MKILVECCCATALSLFLGSEVLSYVKKSRLLGMCVDDKLNWVPHMLELKRNFSNKLDLLKRSRYLPRHVLLKFYYSVISSSVKYGITLWGSCTNSDLVNSVNSLHCRAARILFNLPRDMPSTEVLTYAQWQSISLHYKTDILKIFYKGHNDELPALLSESICTRRRNTYSLWGKHSLAVPRFETKYMKDSLAHRGSVLWNMVNFEEHDFWQLSKKDLFNRIRTRDYIKEFKFDAITASRVRNRSRDSVFIYN